MPSLRGILCSPTGGWCLPLPLLRAFMLPSYRVKCMPSSFVCVLNSLLGVFYPLLLWRGMCVVDRSTIGVSWAFKPPTWVVLFFLFTASRGAFLYVSLWSFVLYGNLWKAYMILYISNESQVCPVFSRKNLLFLSFGSLLFYLLVIKSICTAHFTR